MTKAEQLEALALRCEQATGPDRVINREIAKLYGWHRIEPRHTGSKHGGWIAPDDWLGTLSGGSPILDSLHGTTIHRDAPLYTDSIDAALTLVPEGSHVDVGKQTGWPARNKCFAQVQTISVWIAATPTLALCAAALRARAQMERGK